MIALYVTLGGALGALARYGWMVASKAWSLSFPWSILLANVAGSVAMGLLVGALAKWDVANSEAWRAFLGVGVLGGFTTFSAFSLDAVLLWQRGELAAAAFYVAGSVALSLAGLVLGLWVMR